MSRPSPCRDCSENVDVVPEDIEEMLQHLVKVRNVRLVDDETYKKRLALCLSCQGYAYGDTCIYCGCFVQVRTRIQDKRCPNPLNPKW